MGSPERRGAPGSKAAEGMEAPDHGTSVAPHTPPHGRHSALARQLLDMHQHLRDELAGLRSGTRPAADLRAHCLAFCAAVHGHHTGEDASVFPWLARAHPELRPVLDVLQRDHEQVAEMLVRLRDLATAPDSPVLRSELDGIAALLESHFLYEERTLLSALGSL
ncbi:MAG: hypothetical protein JWO79_2558 [Actinomycetia bacterium]|nr:hypothetical protein [Actinomycetes bacterium]